MNYKVCPVCQQPAVLDAKTCMRCGHRYRTEFTSRPPDPTQMYSAPPGPMPVPSQDNTWLVVAILLGIFLGMFGAHRFYLGHTNTAVAMLVLTLFGILTSCLVVGYFVLLGVSIWAIVDVICIATGSLRPMRPM